MTLDEIVSFAESLLPFLNFGMIILTIDLILKKLGFEITPREYKRKPLESLLFGLGLVLISTFLSLLLRAQLSEYAPLFAFFVLLLIFLAVSQIEGR